MAQKKDYTFRYTRQEDIYNAATHGVGIILAVIGLILLIQVADTDMERIAATIYGLSILAMFTSSTTYHILTNPKAKGIVKKIDHIMIFFIILGTYTPFIFALNTRYAYFIYLILIIISLFGVVLKALTAGRFKKLTTGLYLLLGWMSLLVIPSFLMSDAIPLISLFMLLVGGLLYTAGSLVYMLCNFKNHHAVWHLFVLFAVIAHYIGIYILIQS